MYPEMDNDCSNGTIALYGAEKNLKLTLKICVTIKKCQEISDSLSFTDSNRLCHLFSLNKLAILKIYG